MYKALFEPILKRGHTARLVGHAVNGNYRCEAVDALPAYVKDFGSLTAATWDNDNEDTGLEADQKELVQLRMRVLDDIRVRLKNPPSVLKWRTAKTAFYLPKWPTGDEASDAERELLFMQSEFFYWEDNTPRFDCYSVLALGTARVEFVGWKYKMVESNEATFELLVDGWPGMH